MGSSVVEEAEVVAEEEVVNQLSLTNQSQQQPSRGPDTLTGLPVAFARSIILSGKVLGGVRTRIIALGRTTLPQDPARTEK